MKLQGEWKSTMSKALLRLATDSTIFYVRIDKIIAIWYEHETGTICIKEGNATHTFYAAEEYFMQIVHAWEDNL